jgi:hypothetical protein
LLSTALKHNSEGGMTMTSNATWVVYLMTIYKRTERFAAVCKQSEWDAMERTRPGFHQLVRSGIATETEAEYLARHHGIGNQNQLSM